MAVDGESGLLRVAGAVYLRYHLPQGAGIVLVPYGIQEAPLRRGFSVFACAHQEPVGHRFIVVNGFAFLVGAVAFRPRIREDK